MLVRMCKEVKGGSLRPRVVAVSLSDRRREEGREAREVTRARTRARARRHRHCQAEGKDEGDDEGMSSLSSKG